MREKTIIGVGALTLIFNGNGENGEIWLEKNFSFRTEICFFHDVEQMQNNLRTMVQLCRFTLPGEYILLFELIKLDNWKKVFPSCL